MQGERRRCRRRLSAAPSALLSVRIPSLRPPHLQVVADRLAALHGWPSALRKQGLPAVGCEERRSVLDSLVRTLLSQNTTDKTSARAFATLKERFPDWKAVRHAPTADVADAIRVRAGAGVLPKRCPCICRAARPLYVLPPTHTPLCTTPPLPGGRAGGHQGGAHPVHPFHPG